jgi:hypothetical protein
MNWFSGPTLAYKVIEVEKPRVLPALSSDEVKAMLATLPSNPGFQYILARLKMQRAVIEDALKFTKQETKEDYQWLQAGIFWAGWVEAEMNRLTSRAASIEADTTDFERDAFQQVDKMLERVQPATSQS